MMELIQTIKYDFVELIEMLLGLSLLQCFYLGVRIGFGQIIYDVVKACFAR